MISNRLRTVLDTCLRIKPLDSVLIHPMRHSSVVTTERFYIDHDLDSVAAELQHALRKAK